MEQSKEKVLNEYLELHKEAHLACFDYALGRIELALEEILKKDFGITHTTFQCEYNRCETKEAIYEIS